MGAMTSEGERARSVATPHARAEKTWESRWTEMRTNAGGAGSRDFSGRWLAGGDFNANKSRLRIFVEEGGVTARYAAFLMSVGTKSGWCGLPSGGCEGASGRGLYEDGGRWRWVLVGKL